MIVTRGMGRGSYRGSLVGGGLGRFAQLVADVVRRIKLLRAIFVSTPRREVVGRMQQKEIHVFAKPN